jgi:hypothetical protein
MGELPFSFALQCAIAVKAEAEAEEEAMRRREERQPWPNYWFRMRISFYRKNIPLTKTLSHFLPASKPTYHRRWWFSF